MSSLVPFSPHLFDVGMTANGNTWGLSGSPGGSVKERVFKDENKHHKGNVVSCLQLEEET